MTLKSIDKYFARYTAPEVYPWVSEMLRDIQDEVDSSYMKLPVDADGVPIHVGDELYNGEVIAFGGLAEGGVVFVHRGFEDGNYILEAFASNVTHHAKPRTVEDVLCDMIHEYACTDMTTEQTAAKYADELRDLLGGDGR